MSEFIPQLAMIAAILPALLLSWPTGLRDWTPHYVSPVPLLLVAILLLEIPPVWITGPTAAVLWTVYVTRSARRTTGGVPGA